MSDLISRGALLDAMPKNDELLSIDVRRVICDAPAVDAVPVVRGRVVWKNRFMGGFVPDITITDRAGEKHTGTLDTTHYEPVPYCSVCGKELGVSSLAYCPNCGAKMDLVEGK